jgi:hypothetical protein
MKRKPLPSQNSLGGFPGWAENAANFLIKLHGCQRIIYRLAYSPDL